MGQKINPTGLRISVIKNWESRWYQQSDIKEIKKIEQAAKSKSCFSYNLKAIRKKNEDNYSGVQQFVLALSQRALKRPYLKQKIIA